MIEVNKTTTTLILQIVEELVSANSREELEEIKQHYGKQKVQEAWSLLSDQQKVEIRALAASSEQSSPATDPALTLKHSPAAVTLETPQPQLEESKLKPLLWQLTDELDELEDLLSSVTDNENLSEEEKETQREALFSQWLATSQNWSEKAIAVAGYICHQEALAEARKQESQRLKALTQQAENSARSLRNYLLKEMQRQGKTKIEGVNAKLSVRQLPPRLIVNGDPAALPSEYVKVKYTPRLTELKQALKDNPEFPYAAWSQQEEYGLKIR